MPILENIVPMATRGNTIAGCQMRGVRPKHTGVAGLFYCGSSCFTLARDGRFYFWRDTNIPTKIPAIW